ncbi:DUF4190 domain-containing protein [Streptomyces orinoci]|uniref:DUF4190 domain-containing protein n=1 Tax=Streptomyces orinoci TaxID=67339 RepID=A0ABV3K3F0_STRON|nr:DUF4190 domain-containing protein [Streptomyces orinoci]
MRSFTQTRYRDADFMAVISFVMGLIGLVVGNLVFGPAALILGTVALSKGTTRSFRAVLGIVLGAADLLLLTALAAAQHTASWHL